MGLQIFTQSGVFDPAARGLHAGDTLDVICVGGGSSGVFYRSLPAPAQIWPSVPGGESIFGDLSSADGVRMGRGGPGELISENQYQAGCGAGGYLPGVPMYGGNGGTASLPGGGLAGTTLASASPWCNPWGNGNKGAGSPSNGSAAGNGYGAGGGSYGSSAYSGGGGDAGKIAMGSVTLADTEEISVTVGAGGVNEATDTASGAPGVVLVFW